jgi:hypothetical protein
MKNGTVIAVEERTARLTLLIDPRKKAVFERLCAQEDLTPSQVVRRLIRGFIEERLGRLWTLDEEGPAPDRRPISPGTAKRRTPRP